MLPIESLLPSRISCQNCGLMSGTSSRKRRSSDFDETNGLSEFERKREANIQANESFLSSLGLAAVKSELEVKKKATQRGTGFTGSTGAKRRPVVPTRRSGRVTVDRLKIEVEQAQASGDKKLVATKEAELAAMVAAKASNSYESLIDSSAAPVSGGWEEPDRLEGPLSALAVLNVREDSDSDEDSGNSEKSAQMKTDKKEQKKKGPVAGKPLMAVLRSMGGRSCQTAKSTKSMSPPDRGDKGKGGGNIPSRPNSKAAYAAETKAYMARLKALHIAEDDVAKLTRDRITSSWCHPSESKLLCAAGDKSGHVGLWDVDNAGRGGADGVYHYRPHVGSVEAMHCYPEDPSKLHTLSRDGTARTLDLEKEAWLQSFCAPESIYDVAFTSADFAPESRLWVGRGDGVVSLIDARASGRKYQTSSQAQDSKVNSVQQWPGRPQLLCTAGMGKAGEIRVHDLRKFSSGGSGSNSSLPLLLAADEHTKSINAAKLSPDGATLISVGQDDSVRVWDSSQWFSSWPGKPAPKGQLRSANLRHDNFTGRWLSTFVPVWDPKRPDAFLLGSMAQPRRVEMFQPCWERAEAPVQLLASLGSTEVMLGSVASRNAIHPSLDVLLLGNSSGRLHVMR